MFVIRGSESDSDDGRTAIMLLPGERNLVLAEMRGFLESVQAITEGLADGDMKSIASSAREAGSASARGVPVSLMGKLPLEFKTLGMQTHKAFDDLAMEAEDIGDAQVVLTRLGGLMNNCTVCHAGYRIDVEDGGSK